MLAANLARDPGAALSANIAIIYSGDLQQVAAAFGEAAEQLSARVRLLRVSGAENDPSRGAHREANFDDLDWADGIAFGTPLGHGHPAAELMAFIEGTEPLWTSGRLRDKVVTVFTDQPEEFAPDSVLHPIYDALYRWGAVIVGPRAFELELDARPDHSVAGSASTLPTPRLKAAQYRAGRLARLADVLADERRRRERLEL
jgi:NAD(P)H dehydrogenase (quinone)